jgi:acylphosphatase
VKKVDLVVTGRVQGVFYRYFAKKEANKLNIKGWCRNEKDGSVHIVAGGQEENIDKFIEWAKQGSPLAKVENVEVNENIIENIEGDFEIR